MTDYSEITQRMAEINKHRPFEGESLKQLKNYYKIQTTWASNAVEGNTISDVREVHPSNILLQSVVPKVKSLMVVRVVQLVNFTAELFIVIFCNVSKYGGYQVFAAVILLEKVKFSIVVNA